MSRNWRAWLKQLFQGGSARGQSRPRPRVRLGVEILEDRCCPTVTVLNSFLGMNVTTEQPQSPPDSQVAVGPYTVLSAVNTQLMIQSKSGTVINGPTQFSTLFAPLAGDNFTDPQIQYDEMTGHFYFACLEYPNSPNISYLDFAVSKTANPTDFTSASWTEISRLSSVNEGGTVFADYPQMGFNADAVFVSLNNSNGTGPFHDMIVIMSKAAILSGTPLVQGTNYYQDIVQTDFGIGNGPNRQLNPAQMHGSQPGNLEYFLQQDQDLSYTTNSTVNVVAVQNYLSNSPTYTITTFTVDPYKDTLQGVKQLVPANPQYIEDNFNSTDWNNGLLVGAQNIGPVSGTSGNQARWYEFSTTGTSAKLLQQGTIDQGPGIDTSYPAIAVDPSGNMGMSFVESSASMDPSVYVTGRAATDPLGTMAKPVLIKAGVQGAPIGSRGGDFAAAEFDPSDGTFWAVNEYTFDSGSTDDWGEAIANFTPNPKAAYVNFVYQSLLNRPADPAGLAYWVAQLNKGLPPSTMVLDIEKSPEYLSDVVTSEYTHYLHRAPDAAGLSSWVNFLAAGGGIEQMTAGIAGSPEYYADQGGTNQGFLGQLYLDIFARNPDAAGDAHWLQALANGTSRATVALDLLVSTEDYTSLVRASYFTFLGRLPSASDFTYWVSRLQGGMSNQQFLADILGSAECYARF